MYRRIIAQFIKRLGTQERDRESALDTQWQKDLLMVTGGREGF